MKKLLIVFIFLMVCSVTAQTNDKETLTQLNKTVVSLYQNQKFDEALKSALRAVELSLKIYGGETQETAAVYTNLGVVYQGKKKFGQSTEALQKAVAIYRNTSDLKSVNLIKVYGFLAYSQLQDDKVKDAEASYLKAFETAENMFDKDGKESFQPSLALANFYARSKQPDKADEFYLKSYAAAFKNFGGESEELTQILKSRTCATGASDLFNERSKAYAEAVSKITGDKAFTAEPLNGKAYFFPPPVYSVAARAAGLRGEAPISIKIDEQGNVVEAKAICRNDALSKSAEDAARGAKFPPLIIDGKPIKRTGIIIYNFVL